MSAPYTSPIIVEATIQHQAMEIMNLKKDRDTWRQKAIELGLEANNAIAEELDRMSTLCNDHVNPRPVNQDWDSGYDTACYECGQMIGVAASKLREMK